MVRPYLAVSLAGRSTSTLTVRGPDSLAEFGQHAPPHAVASSPTGKARWGGRIHGFGQAF